MVSQSPCPGWQEFDFRPKTWVVPFDSHKHLPRKISIDTAVTSIALVVGRWNTFGTHIANIEESPLLAFGFCSTNIKH
jgi:hypothetical protein